MCCVIFIKLIFSMQYNDITILGLIKYKFVYGVGKILVSARFLCVFYKQRAQAMHMGYCQIKSSQKHWPKQRTMLHAFEILIIRTASWKLAIKYLALQGKIYFWCERNLWNLFCYWIFVWLTKSPHMKFFRYLSPSHWM